MLSRRSCGGPQAVVVESQQLDHIVDVGVALDPSCARSLCIGEHRVGHDSPLGHEPDPDLLGKAEVRGVVAVQMTDLPAIELERELTAFARPGLNPRPEPAQIRSMIKND